MRIQTLTLKNFRSHEEMVLDLDRFNFVRGPNGCGKSSIQMAVEYLFTGRCELTDAAGRGAEALIRSGEKELEVSATLQSGETICRRRTPRSQIIGINGKRVPADAAETFTKQFGSADVLSAALNADHFVEMPEANQQRLLAQVLDAGKINIPGEIGDALRAVGEEPPELASLSDVEAAHQRFYDLRTEAGRALKALGHMEKPAFPSDLSSVPEVRKKLEDLRQQKEGLVAQKAEAAIHWQNAQARLAKLHAEIDEASSDILSPTEEQELIQVESQRGHTEKLRQELAELLAEQRLDSRNTGGTQRVWRPRSGNVASRNPPQGPGPARKAARGAVEGSGSTETRFRGSRKSNEHPHRKDQQGRAGTGESTTVRDREGAVGGIR